VSVSVTSNEGRHAASVAFDHAGERVVAGLAMRDSARLAVIAAVGMAAHEIAHELDLLARKEAMA
jgi:hypothetical protein